LNHVAGAFGYPFRKGAAGAWAVGLPLVLLLPVTFLLVLGYWVAAVRASATDPEAGPPPWRQLGQILRDGFWISLVLALLTLPFALALPALVTAYTGLTARLESDAFLYRSYALVLAVATLALPWGILLLVLLPAATIRYARSNAARDLFDFPAAIGLVRRRFAVWNLVGVAVVTAWAVGLAGLGLLCVGIVPGVFFAMLVSAHATAALDG